MGFGAVRVHNRLAIEFEKHVAPNPVSGAASLRKVTTRPAYVLRGRRAAALEVVRVAANPRAWCEPSSLMPFGGIMGSAQRPKLSDVRHYLGLRLARIRCNVRLCIDSRRAVSDTFRSHSSYTRWMCSQRTRSALIGFSGGGGSVSDVASSALVTSVASAGFDK